MQGENAVVFEQHHGLDGGFIGKLCIGLAAKFRVVGGNGVRGIKQTETVFETKNAAYSIVHARLGHFSFLYKLYQVDAELAVIRHHCHVDTGIDSEFDGFFSGRSDTIAFVEVINISPVGYNHTVPIQVFFNPTCEQFGIAVERNAIVDGGIDHQ